MIILVDYDNLPANYRRRNARDVIEYIVRRLEPEIGNDRRVNVRLYGGWYDRKTPTPRAQHLASQVLVFPLPLTFGSGHTIMIDAELAYSLAVHPMVHLLRTFRQRGTPENVLCRQPSAKGCTIRTCPLSPIPNFLNRGRCPEPNCALTTEDLLYRPEQKLVDTMLTVDLIHFVDSGVKRLALVSSDDDFWPGIAYILTKGARVIQLHTRRRYRSQYSGPSLGNHVQLSWS